MATQTDTSASHLTVIRAAAMFDGAGSKLTASPVVVIDAGRIVAVHTETRMDDRRWIEDMTMACATAAMWGMPIWPPLSHQATRHDQGPWVHPDRRSLVARLAPRLKALLPLTGSHR